MRMEEHGELLPIPAWRNPHSVLDRFRSLVFWLYADNSALHPRLDSRVDNMLEVRPSFQPIQRLLT